MTCGVVRVLLRSSLVTIMEWRTVFKSSLNKSLSQLPTKDGDIYTNLDVKTPGVNKYFSSKTYATNASIPKCKKILIHLLFTPKSMRKCSSAIVCVVCVCCSVCVSVNQFEDN